MLSLILTTAVFAQVPDDLPAIDAQLFRPPTVSQATLWTRDATRLPNRYWASGVTLHYARDPFVWVGDDGEVTRVVGDLATASVAGGAQLGPVWFGAHVPILIRAGSYDGGETGIGDIAVEAMSTVIDHESAPIGLAFAAQVSLPTSTVDTSLGGGGFGYEFGVVVDRPLGDALVTAELGLHGNPDRELGNVTWSDRLFLRAGAGTPLSERFSASLDVVGAYNLGGAAKGAGVPVEALLGGGYRLNDALLVRAGVGTGITTGIGAPVLRSLVGVHYAPLLERDSDGDGIVDGDDQCRTEPEDLDGVEDADGCPDATRVTVRVQDRSGDLIGSASWSLTGEESADGRSGDTVERFPAAFGLVASAEGYRPNETRVRVRGGAPQDVVITLDRIVQPGRVTVSITDDSGQALEGGRWFFVGSNDAPLASGDEVERPPGSHEIRVEAPGFRPQILPFELVEKGEFVVAVRLKVARVVLNGSQIEIKESIFFETGKATIKQESFELLNEVGQTIRDHPELLKIRIEGHTDSRGSAFSNQELSTARAKSVQAYLVGRGLAAERFDTIGFGEERPLMRADNEAAWSKNRRVDFFIVERAPTAE